MPTLAPWLTPALLDHFPGGVAVLGSDLAVRYSNAEAARLLGTSGLLAPDAAPTRAATEALAQQGPADACCFDLDRSLWIEARATPHDDGVLLSLRDVTADVQAEQARAEGEARQRAGLPGASVLAWMGTATACCYVSPDWERYTGTPLADALGDGWAVALHPDDHAAWRARLAAAEHGWTLPVRLRDQDGQWRRWHAHGLPQPHGDACGHLVTFAEPAPPGGDLAQAALTLCTSLDLDTVLGDAARIAVPALADLCVVQAFGDDGRVLRDAAACADTRLQGAAAEVGSRLVSAALVAPGSEPIRPVDVEAVLNGSGTGRYADLARTLGVTEVAPVVLTSRGRAVGQLVLAGTQQRPLDPEAVSSARPMALPVALAVSNAVAFRTTRESETTLKTLNEELEAWVEARTADLAQINFELSVRNRELQDFAYIASHDLQEPLRKIQSFSHLLATDYAGVLDHEGQRYASRIQDSAARMSHLITDLLAFSRVTTKGTSFVPVNLAETLTAVLSDLELRILETEGQVLIETPLPTLDADPVQMHQLLQNLVGNALKYRRPGVPPVVRVRSSPRAPASVELSVSDNGIGFEQKYATRIFAPFQRLHRREDYEGTGMGLAIVRRIIERHRGTINATSEPGVGTRFVVVLPLAQS